MSDPSYSDRIRHPSGALDPPQEKTQSRGGWLWLVVGLAVLVWFAWRMGWLDKLFKTAASGLGTVKRIANPFGWV